MGAGAQATSPPLRDMRDMYLVGARRDEQRHVRRHRVAGHAEDAAAVAVGADLLRGAGAVCHTPAALGQGGEAPSGGARAVARRLGGASAVVGLCEVGLVGLVRVPRRGMTKSMSTAS